MDNKNIELINSDDSNFSLEIIYLGSGGFIAANESIFNNLNLSEVTMDILEKSTTGTVMVRIGNGGPKVFMVAGVHGNELPPSIAMLYLIDFLLDSDINGTVYLVPFAVPNASMESKRYFDGIDLNRSSHKEGSITNVIFNKIVELNVSALGDFHSSAPNTNPGKEGVFCSKEPSSESISIAEFITNSMGSSIFKYNRAGIPFKGALEDESNLGGIPAVTCEVFSPVSFANEKSCGRSLTQMKLFLEYFGILNGDF